MIDVPQHEPRWVDRAISRLLRGGVLVSMSVVVVGLLLSFVRHPHYVTSHAALGTLTAANGSYPNDARDVATMISEGKGQGLVMLGLLLLIATPVARVAFSIVAFALEGDRLYVAITIVVLLLLLASFALDASG